MKRMRSAPRPRRRGVILIVVVGLMALFALVGVTFVITSEQASRGASNAAEVERYEDPPETLLNRAFLQVLTGTRNRFSSIGPHSLLEDMYGVSRKLRVPKQGDVVYLNDNTTPAFNNYTTPADGFVKNDASYTFPGGALIYIGYFPLDYSSNGLPPTRDYFNGQVITMISGECAGKSARILRYDSIDAGGRAWGRFTIQPFDGMVFNGSQWNIGPAGGDWMLINSRPFNGHGQGYRPWGSETFASGQPHYSADPSAASLGTDATGALDAVLYNKVGTTTSTQPVPLSPSVAMAAGLALNSRSPVVQTYYARAEEDLYLGINHGDPRIKKEQNFALQLDEDYDAPDYQNLHLALTVSQQGVGSYVLSPSYHRPEVIWEAARLNFSSLSDPTRPIQSFGQGNFRRVKRLLQNRPLYEDHPGFDSVNPAYQQNEHLLGVDTTNPASYQSWDVDNDGDGRPDSVWIDVGMEVQTDAQGRSFKPLVAILIRDMDGKVNLNAHGELNEYSNDSGGGIASPSTQKFQSTLVAGAAGTAPFGSPAGQQAPTMIYVPTGQGLSPAEINPLPVLTPGAPAAAMGFAATTFQYLAQGRVIGSRIIEGRYGESGLVGTATPPKPGRTGYDDNWPPPATKYGIALPNRPNLPHGNAIYSPLGGNWGVPTGDQSHGTPTDLDGNGSIAVGANGSPIFVYVGAPNNATNQAEYVDEATELNLHKQWTFNDAGYPVNTDRPFEPSELEWLLRYHDKGVGSRESRLSDLLLPEVKNSPYFSYLRSLMTTESWDVPMPSTLPSPEMAVILSRFNEVKLMSGPASRRGANTADLNFFDLVRARLILAHYYSQTTPNPANPAHLPDVAVVEQQLALLLAANCFSPELRLGLRMNVNRPFGNNFDDPPAGGGPANGIVDDIDEVTNETVWDIAPAMVDRNGDGFINADDRLAPQDFARQLYMLLMLFKDQNYVHPKSTQETAFDSAEDLELQTALRLAQWSINVVDFRDHDSIMTPFEVDLRPFVNDDGSADGSTWDVDGNLTTDEGGPWRAVVWGCEYPSVILSETLAFHDVKLRDTDEEVPNGETTTSGMPMDTDFDQAQVPEGSLFVELLNTRNPNLSSSANSLDLYDANGNVELDKLAPSGAGGLQYPVWRLAIAENRFRDADSDVSSGAATSRTLTQRDSASFEPKPRHGATPGGPNYEPSSWEKFSGLKHSTSASNPVELDRIVWFAGVQPNGHVDEDRIFWNRGDTNIKLAPGQYAVVGPHRNPGAAIIPGTNPAGPDNVTRVGWEQSGTATVYEIDLNTPVRVSGIDGTMTDPYPHAKHPYDDTDKINPAIGIPCAIDHQTNNAWKIGLSVSEPLPTATGGYYPTPTGAAMADSTVWDNTSGSTPGTTTLYNKYVPPRDTPVDSENNRPLSAHPSLLAEPATHNDFTTVFLQRLADPTRPFHEVTNPYITTDFAPVDLTVFNGLAQGMIDAYPQPTTFRFSSRSRGGAALVPPTPGAAVRDLWSHDYAWEGSSQNLHTGWNFGYQLHHTLGYLNRQFHDPNVTLANQPSTPAWMYGDANYYDNDARLKGYPKPLTDGGTIRERPFSWLTWNNRPFTSPMELLLVPASSPARLSWEYNQYASTDFYDASRTDARPNAPFGHLLNFFFSSGRDSDWEQANSTTNFDERDNAASNYFRIFEYLGIPSRMSGGGDVLDPTLFVAGTTAFAPFTAPNLVVPAYREPGRVNINTIMEVPDSTYTTGTPAMAHGRIWQSVINGFPTFTQGGSANPISPHWSTVAVKNVWQSRMGYTPGNASWYFGPPSGTTAASMPTRFRFPFRSYGTRNSHPSALMMTYENPPATNDVGALFIDGTFLRNGNLIDANSVREPLFSLTSTEANSPTAADTAGAYGAFNNSERNPYFRYQPLIKLNNLLTTKSNVYAVWVTVGYFEVERAIPAPSSGTVLGQNVPAIDDANFDGTTDDADYWTIYPDGYTYKQELGADTGEIKRNRGFWIVDRTIPVGFERGEAHNAMDAVILQRVLE